jgi:DNA polymerase-3 subunit epsilon/ATP-dependent DNA helicase DinG
LWGGILILSATGNKKGPILCEGGCIPPHKQIIMSVFVALDIETTGFDAEKDQIIEIAAIRFNENEIIDTFESMVNPEREIPPIITHITGIKEEYLKDAPTLNKIEEELIRFIGDDPIVGHNINFDVNFLTEKGVPLKNNLYDTLQLSSILLPGLPSYSLDTLTRTLKIEHIDKHRAMSDTKASYDLFLILLKEIKEIDPDTLFEINRILDKSMCPLKSLFKSSKNTSKKKQKTETEDKNTEEQSQKTLTKEDVETFFDQNGPLSKVIEDYESRPTQQEIVKKILKSFTEEHHHLIEAGTGTGKTMAYLLAAIYFAQENDTKIVISTYTKNLQDQIINKDIPLIKKALKKIDSNLSFKSTLLKGRRTYRAKNSY